MPVLRSRWRPMLAVASVWVCAICPALAAPEAPASSPALDARAWIHRIHAAANAGNYQGTLVFSAGGTLSSSRVGHYAVGDQVYEQLEALDGREQRILRHNDVVQTLWPQTRTAVLEKRETLPGWSTTPQAVEPQALEQYDMRREADSRVAGRDAAVFLLEPPSAAALGVSLRPMAGRGTAGRSGRRPISAGVVFRFGWRPGKQGGL